VNGKNKTRSKVTIKGYRCNGPCLDEIQDIAINETDVRRWSDPASWDNGRVPEAGEDVVIQSGWNMLFDIDQTPILNMVTINGRLRFEDALQDLHLRAKYIFVRSGELIIGSEDRAYQRNA
jgi:hypothetical protein